MDAPDALLESRLAALIGSLAPAQRADLARRLAAQLRRSQSARIAAQQNPDGSAYEPRKPQLRQRKKNLRMFAQLRTNRFLLAKGNADGAVVSFTREVQRIARVHQDGLRDRVNRRGLEADYPQRRLLGFADAEKTLLDTLLTEHLAFSL